MTEQPASKVPQIRFKEFEGEWQNEMIGEVFIEKKRPIVLKDHQRYELITVKRRNEGIVSRGHLFGRKILVKNYSQLQAGDFVISKRQVVHGATGMIPPKLDGAIVSNEYLVAVDSSKLLTEFLTILASLPSMRQKFFLSSYGVDIEKLFFDAEDWKKRKVTIPSVTEQTQIGEYFRELDRLIGLHQRKQDKLVTLKKAMLQKMFPQPGATTPSIRFKGFEGDWEEKKLGDVATFLNGRAYSQNELLEKGRYRVLRVGNFYTNSSWYYSDLNLAEKFYANKGDLLYTWSASFGPHIWAGEKVIYHYHIWKIELSDALEKSFTLQLLENDKERILENSNGSTMVHITKEGMEGKSIVIPHPAEQQKIGSYFRTLDELIAQHATQLQKLQQIKSACLARMFV